MFTGLKSITRVSDASCSNILEAEGTILKFATVQFDGKSTDAEWTFNEISLKFNGADYKVTDNSETTFSDANPSKSYNFFSKITNIIIFKPGTGTGNVTITLEDDKGDYCVVTAG